MADSTVDRRDFPALKGLIISRMLGFGLTTSSLLFVTGLLESLYVWPCPELVSFSGSSLLLSADERRRGDLSWLLHLRIVDLAGKSGTILRRVETDNHGGDVSDNEQGVFGRSTIITTIAIGVDIDAALLFEEFKLITEAGLR